MEFPRGGAATGSSVAGNWLAIAACCALAAGCSAAVKPRATRASTSTSTTTATPTTSMPTTSTPTTATGSTPTSAPVACTTSGSGVGPETNPPGDIPDSQAFVSFTPKVPRYTLDIPEGWARSDSTNHESFTQKLVAIDILLVARAAPPTVATMRTREFAAIAKTATCARLSDVTAVTRRSGPVIRLVYQDDSAADAVTGKVVRDDVERYEFWRAGTAAILTLSAPAGSDNVDVWRRVTDSFTWR